MPVKKTQALAPQTKRASTAAKPAVCADGLRPVLVFTAHRGVFAGLLPKEQDITSKTLALKQARMALSWGTTRGVLELAESGPTPNSKISSPADVPAVQDVTLVVDITSEAWEKWRKA